MVSYFVGKKKILKIANKVTCYSYEPTSIPRRRRRRWRHHCHCASEGWTEHEILGLATLFGYHKQESTSQHIDRSGMYQRIR